MKNFFLLAGLLLAAPLAHAQVTLEHRYNAGPSGNAIQASRFSNGEIKYSRTDVATNRLTVYNENHSLYQQITLPAVPAGSTLLAAALVSDKLFNTDAQTEYIAFYRRPINNGQSSLDRALILSETGTQLAQIDSVNQADYVFRGATGLKLWASIVKLDASGNYAGSDVKIFALGGTSNPLANRTASLTADAQPYPNPAHERIALPYQLAAGQTATVEVLDLTGRPVRTYAVDATFDHLALQTGELRPGAYTYRVRRNDGTVAAGHKFVVN